MSTAEQQISYRCDQCGSPEIVAVSLLYQLGTRSFSGRFTSGVSQSYAAQASAPPQPYSYLRAILVWGSAILFFVFWGFAGFGRMVQHPEATGTIGDAVAVFFLLGIVCFGGMFLNLRRIARYNREVFPRLHWDWAHTYTCRRCGKSVLISS